LGVASDWRDERIRELEAELAAKDERIAALEKQVAELLERLGRNSRNSHLPPSSDRPGSRTGKQKKGKNRRKRKRGGQPGHGGSHRALLPPEQVDEVVDMYPAHCEKCWEHLPKIVDATPMRHQQTEVPPIKPHTTEWRRHEVTCPRCQHKTRAVYDDDVIPSSSFGPRLMAIMAMLTGIYHLSRRKTVDLLGDVLGVRVSLGALSTVEGRVSDAVGSAVDEAWDRVGKSAVKHTDGTTWLQAGITMSLWTIASTVATVFKILADSSKKTLEPLYGALRGILVSDRAKALNFWAMERRQVCWAHLLRRFVSFSERDGPAGAFGRELLDYTGILFEYWHDYKDGKLPRERFVTWMAALNQHVEATLLRAADADIKGLSGSCADILAHKDALWTFVGRDDVEPTNNHAEREIRAFVLWRKRSFGTQSERGNLFAERLMSVAHTARKQKTDVLEFLTACCQAQCEGSSTPSLFAAT
jgi:transposase